MQTHPNLTNDTKTQRVSLITILEEVPDPRVTATVDHDLPDILLDVVFGEDAAPPAAATPPRI